MSRLSARPAFTQTPWIYTRLQSLSPKRAFIRRGTFVQAELPLSYRNIPVQRSLAPQRVMLSHRLIAYYDLIRASLPLPPVYVLSSRSLPYGLVWAGNEKVPNLICSSFPIVPSSVPRRLGDFFRLLLHRPLWPPPSSHKVGARVSTLGRFSRGSRWWVRSAQWYVETSTALHWATRLDRLAGSSSASSVLMARACAPASTASTVR